MNTLTQARLKELLHYNPRTGVWRWLNTGPGRNSNLVAGSTNTQGYRVVRIDYVDYFAHRLAFFYMRGYWPSHTVDHRNHRRADNRWSNLRDVTHVKNVHNCTVATKGAIVRGVSWDAARGQFKAQLYANGRVRLNERFNYLADAVAAREEAVRLYHNC